MSGKPIGVAFAEIDLDSTKMEQGLKRVHDSLVNNTIKTEAAYQSLSIKSDQVYNMMRANAVAAVDFIKNKTLSSTEEIYRAQKAAADKIQQINEQQFGKHTSLIDGLKSHWIAATVAMAAAYAVVNKAMEYYDLGAKVLQTEESFRLVAKSSGESADKIVANMKRVSMGMVDDSDIMQKAVKGMVLGLSGDQMVKIMEAARISARVTGEDVKTAYENITEAIATGMPKALKRYGLITKEEMATVNAALKAGVENVNLYGIAMDNAAIQAAKFGTVNLTAAESVQIHRARIQDFKETLSVGWVTAVGTALGWMDKWIAANREAALANENIYLETPKTSAPPAGSSEELEQRLSFAREVKKADLDAITAATEAKKKAERDTKEIAAARKKAAEKVIVDEKKRIEYISAQEATWMDFSAKENAEYWVGIGKDYDEDQKKWIANLKYKEDQDEKWREYSEKQQEEYYKGIADDAKKAAEDAANVPQKEADEARKMVTFYNDIRGMEEQYRNEKLNWIEKEAALKKSKGEEEVAIMKWIATQREMLRRENLKGIEEKFDYDNKYTKDTISNMGKVLDAAMSCYDRDSSEYARLAEWKKGIQIAEMAMEVAKNFQLVTFMIAQNAAYAVAMAKKAASLQLTAAEAILTQGEGEPYSAFARIAAMMAIVAGVLGAVGVAGGFGGGGGSISAPSAAYGQNTTVLGGANDQGSESIDNIWKLLEDTYDLQKHTLTGIYENMKQLNANITGIVKAVVLGRIGNTSGGELDIGKSSILGAGTSYPGTGVMMLSGATLGAWFGPIGAVVGAAVGLVLSQLGGIGEKIGQFIFGGSGGSQTLTASGLNVSGGTVKPYQEIYTAGVNPSWGFGGRDPYTTRSDVAIDPATQASLVAFFYGPNGVSTTVSKMFHDVAGELGRDADAAQKVVTDAFLNMGDIDLMGLKTDAEIEAAIKKKISKVEDIAARSIFGDEFINKYIKTNEAAAETVMRLYIDLLSVTDILEMTGKVFAPVPQTPEGWRQHGTGPTGEPMAVWFPASGPTAAEQAIELSEALIELAGGLDNLTESANTYYDKFFTDAEKQIRLGGQLTDVLESMNMTLPDTRAGYRALVEGLDLTTEAGQKAYVALLQWSGGADQYYSVLEEGLPKVLTAQEIAKEGVDIQKQINDLGKTQLQLNNDWIASLDISNRAKGQELLDKQKALDIDKERQGLQDQLNALTDTSTQALTRQRDALDESNRALFDQIQTLKTAKEVASTATDWTARLNQLTMSDTQYKQWSTETEFQGMIKQIDAMANLSAADREKLIKLTTDIRDTERAQLAAAQRAEMFAAYKNFDLLRAKVDALMAGKTDMGMVEKEITNKYASLQSDRETIVTALYAALRKNEGNMTTEAYQAQQLVIWQANMKMASDIQGLAAAEIAAARAADALTKRIEEYQYQIPLLEALGYAEEALAIKRHQELDALSKSNQILQLQTWAVEDLNDAITKFKTRAEQISNFIDEMSRSDLAPVGSVQAWDAEYSKRRLAAMGIGATDQQISDYLAYSKEYLAFQKSYGTEGSYQAIYDAIMGDAQSLGMVAIDALDIAEQQLEAIKSQVQATIDWGNQEATLLRSLINAVITGKALPEFAEGGISTGSSSGYTARLHGTEVVISPRSDYPVTVKGKDNVIHIEELRKLRASIDRLVEQGGEFSVNIPVNIDGREIGSVVAKQIPRHHDLRASIDNRVKAVN